MRKLGRSRVLILSRQMKSYIKLKHMVELDSNKFVYVFPDEYCSSTQSATRNEAEKLVKTMLYYKQRIVNTI